MTGTVAYSENVPSNLPAQYLAYKQKAEEQKAGLSSIEPARIGNTNCWGSFMQFQMLAADLRTTSNSNNSSANLMKKYDDDAPDSPNNNEGLGSSGHDSSEDGNGNSNDNKNEPPHTSSSSLWSRVSGSLATATKTSTTEVIPAHSAELEKNSGFPKNTNMTNIERLKSMAASSVRQPEIPQTAANNKNCNDKEPSVVFQTQSSFPSLASSLSDGSLSMDSSHYSSSSSSTASRFWNIGKYFSSRNGKNNMMGHIGSGDQDPSFGELPDKNKNCNKNIATSYFTSSKVEETKKDLDIEKLQRLRDQAAGLVPQSHPVAEQEQQQEETNEKKEKAKEPSTTSFESLESQIDDMEHELYKRTKSAASHKNDKVLMGGQPPHLRMDGFDDVHDSHIGELPSRAKSSSSSLSPTTNRRIHQNAYSSSAGPFSGGL